MTAVLYCGDALTVLKTLPERSVRCCVTSPPYWGLRDYGTARWEGGDANCEHRSPSMREGRNEDRPTMGGGIMATNSYQLRYAAEQARCGKCGARRIDAQLGLEPTPEQYVENLVAVFREVRRVLTDDGTLWLNLGDSYAYPPGGGYNPTAPSNQLEAAKDRRAPGSQIAGARIRPMRECGTLKTKDLVGIPWRVAFALQADGWWLRSDIVWSKPNPMPESVRDRPTRSHEYVFLLSKSARYYYDGDAVAEISTGRDAGNGFDRPHRLSVGGRGDPEPWRASATTRNARTVWEITTQPYPAAHFATFPEELARRCILAGTSQRGGCPECGAVWERIVVHEEVDWRPTCNCHLPNTVDAVPWTPVPDTVLDPFGGSGTVASVAVGNGRSSIYIDLNPDYLSLAENRIGPMLCQRAA